MAIRTKNYAIARMIRATISTLNDVMNMQTNRRAAPLAALIAGERLPAGC
jgi:hypothetical protein